jgi:hypothetical protein
VMATPGMYPASMGTHHSEPVELIDVFPTLVDLTHTQLHPNKYLSSSTAAAATRLQSHSLTSAFSFPQPHDDIRGECVDVADSASRNVDKDSDCLFTHHYCDILDGVSLLPVFLSPNNKHAAASHHERVGITQKMACKSPNARDNDPTSPGWSDYCPFKKIPRSPPFGEIYTFIVYMRIDLVE